MINKFQQGGKLQQLELIFAMIDLQPEEAIKQLVQSGAKPEEIMLIVLVGALLGKIRPEVASAIQQMFQQLLQAAKHGAKLQYLKSLKHQCADDEELVYYKKGGSVGCGCKKKEDGGEVTKAQKGTAVEKFKARKMSTGGEPKIMLLVDANKEKRKKKLASLLQKKEGNTWKENTKYYADKNATYKEPTELDNAVRDRKENPENIVKKKTYGGAVKAFKEKCGAKMKKHQLGGSLNGIPFYQGGTFKGGVLYRFRRSTNNMNNGYKTYSDLIMMTQDPLGYPTYDTPPISAGRTIYVTPLGNDTIFYTNNDILNKTPKGDLNLKKAKLKFYQLIKKAPIEGEEYRMTPYWNSNLFDLDMVRNRALKGN